MKLFTKKKKVENTFKNNVFADEIAPIYLEEHKDYIEIGDNGFETTVLAIIYPQKAKIGFARKLNNIEGNISLTRHLTPIDLERTMKLLNSSVRNIRSTMKSPGLKESEKAELKKKLQNAERAVTNLVENSTLRYFDFSLSVKIHAETKKELDRLIKKVKNRLTSCGITSYVCKGSMLDSFRTHLLTCEDHLHRYGSREMSSEEIATLAHFDTNDTSVSRGIVIGTNPITNQLVSLDTDGLPNGNGVAFGSSGYGKTTFFWMLMTRKWTNGERVIVVDPEGEYVEGGKKLDATIIDVSNGTDSILNPLEVINYSDNEESSSVFLNHLETKKIFFSLMFPMSETVLSYLEDCLTDVYTNFGINEQTELSSLKPTDYPILEDLYLMIEDKMNQDDSYNILKDFKVVLKKYVYGSNKKIFNGHTNIDINNDFIIFNLKELKQGSNMQVCAMHNTVDFIWNLLTKNVCQTTVFIDEMHVLNNPKQPQGMELVHNMYKRIRKYGEGNKVSSVWAATQETKDAMSVTLDGFNYGAAVVANSSIKVLLPLDGKSIQTLQTEADMKFSQEEIRLMRPKKKNKGKALILYAEKKLHAKIELTEIEWETLGKKPNAV